MASVLSGAGLRFLFRTDEGRIGRQVWWLGALMLASPLVVMSFIWLALAPNAHRSLAERNLFDPLVFVSYAYLSVFAFIVLLAAVCFVNLSAKRLRDAGDTAALASVTPLTLFLLGAAHWLQPRVADAFPGWLLLTLDVAALAIVGWQVWRLGFAASRAG